MLSSYFSSFKVIYPHGNLGKCKIFPLLIFKQEMVLKCLYNRLNSNNWVKLYLKMESIVKWKDIVVSFFFWLWILKKVFVMCVCGERNSNSRTILIMNENTYLVYFTLYHTVPERKPVAAQGIFGKAATQRVLRVEDIFFFLNKAF